jgi:hypothetical protein
VVGGGLGKVVFEDTGLGGGGRDVHVCVSSQVKPKPATFIAP